eukprot:364656-Chlamydomonas_euryale.AAC.4
MSDRHGQVGRYAHGWQRVALPRPTVGAVAAQLALNFHTVAHGRDPAVLANAVASLRSYTHTHTCAHGAADMQS